MAGNEEKKRKRPWRQAVRRAAKKARISQAESKTKIEELKEQMESARFRYLNEQLYTMPSKEAVDLFRNDEEAFDAYHSGYRTQVTKWPINPVDVIIKQLSKKPVGTVVADLGCGDAKIARALGERFTVHSFDLVSSGPTVTACDMAHLPLDNDSVDVVVFCLSLMGTNLPDFFREANRVLRHGGLIKVAEVWSRFRNLKKFLNAVRKMGFDVVQERLINDYFELITLKKSGKVVEKRPLGLILEPCLYKKR